MEKQTQRVQRILSKLDEDTQMKIILECASKIGTKEWQEAINDLIKRVEKTNNK